MFNLANVVVRRRMKDQYMDGCAVVAVQASRLDWDAQALNHLHLAMGQHACRARVSMFKCTHSGLHVVR